MLRWRQRNVRELFGVVGQPVSVESRPLDEVPRRLREGIITHALVLAAFSLLEIER